MKVLIVYDNGINASQEIEYFSKYNRINARGIREEAKQTLINKLGWKARNYTIQAIYRND